MDKALFLHRPGGGDPDPDVGGRLGGRRQVQVGGIDGGHVHMQVDAVEQGTGNPGLVSVCAFGRLRTGFGRIVEMAAAARVHGGDELDARRVGDVGVDARNGGAPGFQRLAHGLQRATLEFRQFVQEQHAEMGQRHFAGSGPVAAADQRRRRRRMVRVAERAFRRQAAVLPFAGEAANHADFEDFRGVQRRHQARQARRQHRLSSPRRADQ